MACFIVPLVQAVAFTALDQAGGGLVMLREMLTVGVPMSLVLTAAWLVWAFVRDRKRAAL